MTRSAGQIATSEGMKRLWRRRKQPERALHTVVAQFLDRALPKDAYWFPVPNASKRGLRQAMAMKRAGEFKPGVPDLFVVYRGHLIGIELKVGRNKPTAQQQQTHDALRRAGAYVGTCNDLSQVTTCLSLFMLVRASVTL